MKNKPLQPYASTAHEKQTAMVNTPPLLMNNKPHTFPVILRPYASTAHEQQTPYVPRHFATIRLHCSRPTAARGKAYSHARSTNSGSLSVYLNIVCGAAAAAAAAPTTQVDPSIASPDRCTKWSAAISLVCVRPPFFARSRSRGHVDEDVAISAFFPVHRRGQTRNQAVFNLAVPVSPHHHKETRG